MQLLKDRIRKDGKIKAGNVLKVDSFLNHQMDTDLFVEIGKEFKRRFADCEINKILTIEASGPVRNYHKICANSGKRACHRRIC